MYTFQFGPWGSVFAVPCNVVDEQIRLAGATQLKTILWVLRHAGEPFTADEVARAVGKPAEEVADALAYWKESGLLPITETDGDNSENAPSIAAMTATPHVQAAFLPPPQTAQEPAVPSSEPPAEKPKKLLTRPQKPDSAFVARRILEDAEVATLMQEAEQILGHLLSGGASGTLLMLHDDFGLPTDVLLMLLQFAVSAGKTSMRYIERVGMDWAEEEIFTHEQAEDKLRRIAESASAWNAVSQVLGLTKRSPSAKEEAFVSRWVNEWRFQPSMVREAYERCVDAKGQLSFGYMNGILSRWQSAGIQTPAQAREEQEQKSAAKQKEQVRGATYDIDEYERSGAFDQFDRM